MPDGTRVYSYANDGSILASADIPACSAGTRIYVSIKQLGGGGGKSPTARSDNAV